MTSETLLPCPPGYWWCENCGQEKPPNRVTYWEKCDDCGDGVQWKEPVETRTHPTLPESVEALKQQLCDMIYKSDNPDSASDVSMIIDHLASRGYLNVKPGDDSFGITKSDIDRFMVLPGAYEPEPADGVTVDVDKLIKECRHDSRWTNISDIHIECIIKWVFAYHSDKVGKPLSVSADDTRAALIRLDTSFDSDPIDCQEFIKRYRKTIRAVLAEKVGV